VPNFAVDELLSVVRGERDERDARIAELLRRHDLDVARAPELAERLGSLVASADAKAEPPSAETLALALLSLIALETRS
jgi:hypothetical protein